MGVKRRPSDGLAQASRAPAVKKSRTEEEEDKVKRTNLNLFKIWVGVRLFRFASYRRDSCGCLRTSFKASREEEMGSERVGLCGVYKQRADENAVRLWSSLKPLQPPHSMPYEKERKKSPVNEQTENVF